MKLFFIKQNKYKLADKWINALQTREEKKRGLQVVVTPQNEVFEKQFKPAIQSQVVFTKYDNGHNLDEAQKIQQLYTELSNAPLAPAFA